MSRSTMGSRMGNGHEAGGDGYQSGAASPGLYRRFSMNRSSSSIFEDVEMAQDEVSRADRRHTNPSSRTRQLI